MKKLTKTLSLVLVVAMVLGLCVIGAGATFTDKDKITADYSEAVTIMTDLKVVSGFPSGAFQPAGTLTRAQAAVILTNMTLGANAAAVVPTTVTFKDVPASYWGYKYIEYCYQAGLVAGTGNGNYSPTATLTGYQWALMVMRAIGIDVSGMTGSNWTIATAKTYYASDTAFSDVTISNVAITREQATQIAYDGLFNATGATEGYPVYKTGVTDPIAYYDSYAEALSGAALYNTLSNTTNYSAGVDAVTIKAGTSMAKTVFGVTMTTGSDALGHPANIYTAATKTEGTTYGWTNKTKAIASTALKTYTAADFDATEVSTLTKAAWNFDSAAVYYNGATGIFTKDQAVAGRLAAPGYKVELFGKSNASGGYTVSRIVVTEYYLATVTAVATTSKNVTLQIREAGYYLSATKGNGTYKSVTIAAPTASTVTPSANYSAVASLVKGDTVLVCVKPGWESDLTILDVQAVKTVTGTLTATSVDGYYTGYIKIDGTKYYMANEYDQTALTVGGKYDFYVGADGCVYGASVVSEATSNLAYIQTYEVSAVDTSLTATNTAKAAVVFADGTRGVVDIYVSSTGLINGTTARGASIMTDTGITGITAGNWYSYVKQTDGTYKFVAMPATYANASVTVAKANASVTVGGATKAATSNTVLTVVYYNGTTKTATASTYTGYANFPAVTGTAAVKTNSVTGTLDSITVYTTTSVTSTAKFGYYVGAGDLTADGQYYNFVIDGKVVSYLLSSKPATMTAGTVYQVTASSTTTAIASTVTDGDTLGTTYTYYNGVGTVKYVDPNNAYVIVTRNSTDYVCYVTTSTTCTSVVGLAKGVVPAAAVPAVGDTVVAVTYVNSSTGMMYTADAFITANA